jgi:hypothetical protein
MENKTGTLRLHPKRASRGRNKSSPARVHASNKDRNAMMAALGTLTFLVTLWLLVVVGAAIFEQSGAKIAAALKGGSFASATPRAVSVRMRARTQAVQPMRAAPRLRAAA